MACVRLLTIIAIVTTVFSVGFLIAIGPGDVNTNLMRAVGFGAIAGLAWCMVYREKAHRREIASLVAIHRGELAALAELIDEQAERIDELEKRAAAEDVDSVMDHLAQRRNGHSNGAVAYIHRRVSLIVSSREGE